MTCKISSTSERTRFNAVAVLIEPALLVTVSVAVIGIISGLISAVFYGNVNEIKNQVADLKSRLSETNQKVGTIEERIGHTTADLNGNILAAIKSNDKKFEDIGKDIKKIETQTAQNTTDIAWLKRHESSHD